MATHVPISVASRKGVSWLADQASEGPVTLTSFGRPAAVVIAPDRVDHLVAELRNAAYQVVNAYVTQAFERSPSTVTLESVCERLDVDVDEIRARAAARA